MCKLLLLMLLFFVSNMFAKEEHAIQQDINQNLWAPLKQAFETLDAPTLNALYAKEVLRVTPRAIDTENNFKSNHEERFKNYRNTQTKIQLDFWFDSRHTRADTSYEIGFYRMKLRGLKGVNTVYGQFHIVLKKEGGAWKITQDGDTITINGTAILASDFEKQKPMEFE